MHFVGQVPRQMYCISMIMREPRLETPQLSDDSNSERNCSSSSSQSGRRKEHLQALSGVHANATGTESLGTRRALMGGGASEPPYALSPAGAALQDVLGLLSCGSRSRSESVNSVGMLPHATLAEGFETATLSISTTVDGF